LLLFCLLTDRLLVSNISSSQATAIRRNPVKSGFYLVRCSWILTSWNHASRMWAASPRRRRKSSCRWYLITVISAIPISTEELKTIPL
jgi:hypothetical protein